MTSRPEVADRRITAGNHASFARAERRTTELVSNVAAKVVNRCRAGAGDLYAVTRAA